MLIVCLQLWGSLYLLNKMFFSFSERSKSNQQKNRWLITAWITNLIALPAWVIVFIMGKNWVAAFVELGGAPSMIIGLIIALRGKGTEPRYLHYFAKISVLFGIGLSIYEYGGINTINQFLEFGISAGFLFGTYQLSKGKSSGYLWFVFGNLSGSALMFRENFFILMAQQLASLLLVSYAYYARKIKFKIFSKTNNV